MSLWNGQQRYLFSPLATFSQFSYIVKIFNFISLMIQFSSVQFLSRVRLFVIP